MKTKYQLFLLVVIVCALGNSQNSAIQFVDANYAYGLKATNVQANDMRDVYVDWKTRFLRTCNNGRFRVAFTDPNFTVSEGIAYGMLLTAYANDKQAFDGLWLYYKDHRNSNGVMNWKIEGCSSVNEQNGATDAELDAAYALMVAEQRWGNSGAIDYGEDAKTLINAIKVHEVESGTNVLKPGDAWGGSNTTNPSYFATGYFRAFGEYTGDTAFWNAVASKCYDIINANLSKNNAVYNLVSDWTKANGDYSTEVDWANEQGKTYNYDAARTPWRTAIDYVWYGNPEALSYNTLCNNFVNNARGFGNIYPGYRQDGTPIRTDYKDPTFTGAYALAAMSSTDQNFVNSGYTVLKAQVDNTYFGNTLRAIYMFGLSGNLFNTASRALSTKKDDFIEFSVYPNPVTDILSIKLKNTDLYRVKIFNIIGKKVFVQKFKTSSLLQIDMSQYSTGVYFVTINNNRRLKLVKQ